MASRIQAKSPAGGPAPDVPDGLPVPALTGPWPVAAEAAAGACGDPGAGALPFAVGSDGFAGAVPSGGTAMAGEADRAGGSATACESGRAGGTWRTAIP